MANTSNARENLEGRNRENDVINQAEFRAFQQETQQALLAIQATLAGLTTRNNHRYEVEEGPERDRGRNNPNRENLPIPRRHLTYEEELSDDEEYVGHVFGHHQQNPYNANTGGRGNQMFRMKMDLPNFNGQLQIERFLDWLAMVERFFDYMDIPEDKRVKLVAYKLIGGASAWWEQLQLTRMRQGKGMIQTWSKMRRLLRSRYLPPDYEQILFQ